MAICINIELGLLKCWLQLILINMVLACLKLGETDTHGAQSQREERKRSTLIHIAYLEGSRLHKNE